MKPEAIFLDNGGVMYDNDLRAAEWRRLIGEFLAPRLGGEPAAWGDANHVVFDRQWRRFLDWQRERGTAADYFDFFEQRSERERWLGEMCQHVGVTRPAGDACYALASETEDYVVPRVRASYPEAAAAVRDLRRLGYTLFTASGEASRDLDHYLRAMGVRGCFSELFGPDLVATLKAGPEFYERMLAHAGIVPGRALVVDNEPHAVAWAAQAGAATVHVRRDSAAPAPVADATVSNLVELMEVVRRL